MENTIQHDSRFVIVAKTPEYYKEVKRLRDSGIGREQMHRILAITQGNIIGLKVAKHVGSDKIWFTFRGRRYDIKKNGTLVADVKVGKPSIVPQALAKTVKCQLCGGQTPIPQFVTEARCPQCGFPLVRCNVVRRK